MLGKVYLSIGIFAAFLVSGCAEMRSLGLKEVPPKICKKHEAGPRTALGPVPEEVQDLISAKLSGLEGNPQAKPVSEWTETERQDLLESLGEKGVMIVDRVVLVEGTVVSVCDREWSRTKQFWDNRPPKTEVRCHCTSISVLDELEAARKH